MGDGIVTIAKVLGGLDATRKPLRKVIPKLNELREDPAKVLEAGPIEIKVSPPYGVCTFIGLFFPGMFIAGICIHVLNWKPPGPEAAFTFLTWLVTSVLFGVLVGSFINMGKIVLRLQGLEVHDRHSHVFCPWSLFSSNGVVEVSGQSEIQLPVQPAMVPLIEYHRNGEIEQTGNSVKNRHFRINSSETCVLLKDHYLAKGLKLGELILEVAPKLGAN